MSYKEKYKEAKSGVKFWIICILYFAILVAWNFHSGPTIYSYLLLVCLFVSVVFAIKDFRSMLYNKRRIILDDFLNEP